MSDMCYTGFAVRDNITGKYFSKRRENGLNWSWTTDPEWVHLFKTRSLATNNISHRGEEVVEVTVTMSTKPVGVPTSTAELVRLASAQKFNKHIEQYLALKRQQKLTATEDDLYGKLRRLLRQLDPERLESLGG